MKIYRIDIANIGYNNINGYYAHIFELDINSFERTFLGFDLSEYFFYIHILFITITVFDKSLKQNNNG